MPPVNEERPLTGIYPSGPVTFAGDVGEVMVQVCKITALSTIPQIERVGGVNIRYRILAGPLRLQGERIEVEVQTDQNGNAAVDATFRSIGTALIVAELVGSSGAMIFFRAHSDRTVHRLSLYSQPTFTVDPGVVTARIVALDHHDRPVEKAKLIFEGTSGPDSGVSGEVKELGNGEYEGVFRTNKGGPWEILAQDVDTKTTVHTCVQMLPGKPSALRLVGETDPRKEQPYGELLLHARLEDRFGNALDPHRLRCVAQGRSVPVRSIVVEEARFSIRFAGYGSVDLTLSDSDSRISHQVAIAFAATWLQNPGVVEVGSSFQTVLYALPRPERPAQRATIEIEFNPEVISFEGLAVPPPGGPQVSFNPRVEGRTLTIAVESAKPLNAQEYPDGIAICTVKWKCQREGNQCFRLTGRMSPSTPPWELCVDQKRKLQSCICVNVIYPPGNAPALAAGTAAGNEAIAIISRTSNVTRCCPILRANILNCEITTENWTTIAGLIGTVAGTPTVTASPQFGAIRGTRICQRDHCINLYMIPVAVPVPGGTVQGNTIVGPPGTSVIDPTAATSGNNVGAHEIGHALGLNGSHASSAGQTNNLMNPIQPHGTELTPEQCRTIFENLKNYPC